MIPIARPSIGEEEIRAVTELMRKGELAHGPTVEAFESAFAEYHGMRSPGVAVSSGTAALELLLRAHGIGRGDEVIVPSFSFFATASAVIAVGATPVFADIDPVTFLLTPDTVLRVMTAKTRAVILVHLFGRMAPVSKFVPFSNQGTRLLVLEDACQAHGAFEVVDGGEIKSPGSLSDGAAFSFYPTKNMTTIEGGMVLTRHENVRTLVRLLRNHGMSAAYKHELVGGNYRMTSIGAAIGLEQLKKLPMATLYRQHLAATYEGFLADQKLSGSLALPEIVDGHVFHQYTVRVPRVMNAEGAQLRRDRIVARLNELGVGARVYYPTPIHKQPALAQTYGSSPFVLDGTEQACDEVMSLPIYAGLSATDHETVAQKVAQALEENSR